jgi:hypothetical protein
MIQRVMLTSCTGVLCDGVATAPNPERWEIAIESPARAAPMSAETVSLFSACVQPSRESGVDARDGVCMASFKSSSMASHRRLVLHSSAPPS